MQIIKRQGYKDANFGTWLLIIVCYLVIVPCFLTQVVAQQATLSLSPPLIELTIKPGKSLLIAYTLKNLGDPNIIRAKILSFVPAGEGGNLKLKDSFEGPIRFTLDNSDIELDKPFFLKTKESQQLLLRLRVPEGAPEGDYYYTLIAQTDPPPISEGLTKTRASAGIGANLVITVTESGKIDLKGSIKSFEVAPRWKFKFFGRTFNIFDSNDKIPVSLVAQNTGRNVIKPDGEIILKGNFGEKASYEIVPDNILAESSRVLRATPSATLDHELKSPVSLVLSGLYIGNYRLATNLSFGEGSPVVFAQARFTALPIKFLSAIIVVCIVVFFYLRRNRDKI